MAFPLSFLTGQPAVNQVNTGQMSDVSFNGNVVKQLSAQNGQTITGEIVKMEDGNVIMKVGDEFVQARLGSDMDVSVGQNMTFQVQNQNGLIALRALFTNTDISPTTLKALDAAALPVNDQTTALATQMMKEGMNISPQSLQMMYREVVDHPEASGEMLVKMARLQIPISSNNITQFQNYQNLDHELSKGITEMSKSFMELTGELAKENPLSENGLFDAAAKVFDTVAEGDLTFFKEPLSQEQQKLAQAFELVKDDPAIFNPKENASENILENAGEKTQTDMGGDFLKQLALAGKADNAQLQGDNSQALTQQTQAGDELTDTKLSGEGRVSGAEMTLAEAKQLINETLSDDQRVLMGHLRELGVSSQEMPKLLNASPAEVMTFLSELAKKPEELSGAESRAFTKLLTSPAMEKLFGSQLKEALALKPEDVADKEKVSRLYDSIVEKSAKLSETLQEMGKGESMLAQNAQNLSQNVNFMHDLNQVMQYIQIPFQMQGKDANGELYVFTNKKSLANSDGTVSAFLHLDMDHLGPTSVYVSMKETKVATRFYVANDEILDFISENIHLLDERLAKRGYQMNATMTVKQEDEPFDVIESMQQAKNSMGVSSRLLSSHGFDMRA